MTAAVSYEHSTSASWAWYKCMLNRGLEVDKWLLNELIHPKLWFNRHLFHAGRRQCRVSYSVVSLITHDCTGVLSTTSYLTVDCLVDSQYECQPGIYEFTKLYPTFTKLLMFRPPLLPSSERFLFATKCLHGQLIVIGVRKLIGPIVSIHRLVLCFMIWMGDLSR